MKKTLYALLLSLGISVSLNGCGKKDNQELPLEKHAVIHNNDQEFVNNFLDACIIDHEKKYIDFSTCCSRGADGYTLTYLDKDFRVSVQHDYDENGKIDEVYSSSIKLPKLVNSLFNTFNNLSIGNDIVAIKSDDDLYFVHVSTYDDSIVMELVQKAFSEVDTLTYTHEEDKTIINGFVGRNETQYFIYSCLSTYFYNYYYSIYEYNEEIDINEEQFSAQCLTLHNIVDKI